MKGKSCEKWMYRSEPKAHMRKCVCITCAHTFTWHNGTIDWFCWKEWGKGSVRDREYFLWFLFNEISLFWRTLFRSYCCKYSHSTGHCHCLTGRTLFFQINECKCHYWVRNVLHHFDVRIQINQNEYVIDVNFVSRNPNFLLLFILLQFQFQCSFRLIRSEFLMFDCFGICDSIKNSKYFT